MIELQGALETYGVALVFAVVLLEQTGLPLPSLVALLGAGALIGQGRLDPWTVGAAALLAALGANWVWYRAGWAQGPRILRLVCRISLDPDACVRVSETVVGRLGVAFLLVAKFVPGLNTLAAPLAGALRVPPRRFWLLNGAGTVLWVGTGMGLGALFSERLEALAAHLVRWGLGGALALAGLVVGWIAFKALQRFVMARHLRGERISVEALHGLLENGGRPLIVDLRHALHRASVPYAIPGALHIAPGELRARAGELPRDRDLILVCS